MTAEENSWAVKIPPHLGRLVPLLADGLTNAEIAATLSLAHHTIEGYVAELKLRVGARDRVALVLACRACQL